jgi:hypothetical protein
MARRRSSFNIGFAKKKAAVKAQIHLQQPFRSPFLFITIYFACPLKNISSTHYHGTWSPPLLPFLGFQLKAGHIVAVLKAQVDPAQLAQAFVRQFRPEPVLALRVLCIFHDFFRETKEIQGFSRRTS